MNLKHFAQELQDQCDEMCYLRIENEKLKQELAKYQDRVSDELQFWQNTYGNILTKLVEKE